MAVRGYPGHSLSYRGVEEPLAERRRGRSRHSLSVSEPVDSAIHGRRPAPPALHSRPMVRRRDDVIMSGRWRYLYRAVDQFGQVIDVLLSPGVMSQLSVASSSKRWREGSPPAAVTTDRAAVNSRVFDELVPDAGHVVERHASNSVEADHGRLEASAASDPRTETVPHYRRRCRWARLRTEPAPTLRIRRWSPSPLPGRRLVRRAHCEGLNQRPPSRFTRPSP